MLDRREELALLPLADPEAELLLAAVPADERSQCWWLVLRDGSALRGDRGAGVAALGEIRLTRPAGTLLRTARLSGLVDAFDRLVARRRGPLGRFVPDGPAPRRYP